MTDIEHLEALRAESLEMRRLKPNYITLVGSELVRSWFRADLELVRSRFEAGLS